MKHLTAVLSLVAFVTAAPFQSAAQQDLGRRDGTRNVQTCENWAGAILYQPPAGQAPIDKATGTFTMPSPNAPSGSVVGDYSAAAWVGVNGNNSDEGFLQAGCDFSGNLIDGPSYSCWYEWWPDPHHKIDGLNPQQGDKISITITTTPDAGGLVSQGTVSIDIQGTPMSTNFPVTAPCEKCPFQGGGTAQWIVEDFTKGGVPVPFASFDTLSFSTCQASRGDQLVDLAQADIWNMEKGGKRMASASIPSNSQVDIKGG